MGGRGASSGVSNVVQFPRAQSGGKWHYPGVVESADRLVKAAQSAKTDRQVQAVYKGVQDFETSVQSEISAIQRGDVKDGDMRALMAQRRRVRLAKKKLLERFS